MKFCYHKRINYWSAFNQTIWNSFLLVLYDGVENIVFVNFKIPKESNKEVKR